MQKMEYSGGNLRSVAGLNSIVFGNVSVSAPFGWRSLSALCLLIAGTLPALAQTPIRVATSVSGASDLRAKNFAMTSTTTQPDAGQPAADLRVLDIEKRRIVEGEATPADASPTCDVLIIGGGTGGVAAAEAAAKRGMSVIITEPTSMLGGQFTSQMVSVPDENRFIEQDNGPSTDTYRQLRERIRRHYALLPAVVEGRSRNIGSCWVSRVAATPEVWQVAIDERLYNTGRVRIYRRHQLRTVGILANGRVNYADVVDLDTGKVTRIAARFVLDATEDGDALHRAGLPTALGQEARETYNEPGAPPEAHPEWVQSFTYCFMTRWVAEGPRPIVAKPAEYDYFKSLGEYTLNYEYSDPRGTVPYQVLKRAPNSGGPFWTYRRLVASDNYRGFKSPKDDIALINWRGNDFHEESYIGKPLEEQVRILNRAQAFAQGFLYWLQTECPRDEGGTGYPEMQLITDNTVFGVGEDGFALHPYIRESRRLKAQFVLNENHLLAPSDNKDAKWGEAFFDSVGCALYAIDIHPAKGEPPLLTPALPYHIPLGAFLTTEGPKNVLPAAKNFGASRLAAASARMHPTEWLVGEVAGSLAAFCIREGIDDPAMVRNTPELLARFQQNLRDNGITLYWEEILAEAEKSRTEEE
ncbi:MAG: FAD-dependent oxidoreductase [Armatimonadaceae bacterium]